MSGVTLYPVESSAMTHIGYDEARQSLNILFDGGKLYEFDAVRSAVYEALRDADSKGQFYNREIHGQYKFRQVKASRAK